MPIPLLESTIPTFDSMAPAFSRARQGDQSGTFSIVQAPALPFYSPESYPTITSYPLPLPYPHALPNTTSRSISYSKPIASTVHTLSDTANASVSAWQGILRVVRVSDKTSDTSYHPNARESPRIDSHRILGPPLHGPPGSKYSSSIAGICRLYRCGHGQALIVALAGCKTPVYQLSGYSESCTTGAMLVSQRSRIRPGQTRNLLVRGKVIAISLRNHRPLKDSRFLIAQLIPTL